ncbi:uncharacterized protein LOC105693521 [Athalia rosae]|uniref:uncharacterized protein LOC105693521 n=1 Tax=Athalia rosae TaxID=37344 RepID=UPI0020336E23|nr:uncharacterized protein LOC105693521 [Athalia rosae]
MAKTKGVNGEPEESAMGFKDKQKALDTLKVLDGRDISYQYHVITSFVSRAKRTIQITKDEEKLANLREAQQVFEDWLTDYKENHRSKENLSYLPIETVKGYRALAKKYDILNDKFYSAYRNVKGDYKALRSMKTSDGEETWDVSRNRELKAIIGEIKAEHIQWFETDDGVFRGLPTKEHTRCISLGYSPEPTKIKKLISQVKEKFGEIEDNEDEDQDMDSVSSGSDVENRGKGVAKRRHESSSNSDDSDDEPKKKSPKKDSNDKRGEKAGKGKTDVREEKEEGGLSFKNKQRAVDSLKSLEGRDVAYQYHAITGLVRRAERVISCTKDEEKIKNMKEAIEVYENWVTDYNVNGRSKENFGYLPLDIVQSYKPLADRYEIEDTGFLKAYDEVDGDYKRLRSVKVPGKELTWDIERNNNLRPLIEGIKSKHIQWFETDPTDLRGLPTKEHTQCIMWGFSHDAAKIKKLLPTLKQKLN